MSRIRDPAVAPERTVRRGFWRRLFSWTALRRLLLGVVVLLALVVLLITVDNRRAARAWQACRVRMEARGEVLDWRKLVSPPPGPDEENFAATPLLREISAADAANRAARRAGQTNAVVARLNRVRDDLGAGDRHPVPGRGDIHSNVRCDLAAWADFYVGNTNYPDVTAAPGADPGRIVLAALARFDGEVEELRQAAAARPRARFPVDGGVDNPFDLRMPHVLALRGVNRTLALRAIACLALGRSGAALNEWNLELRLADSLRGEPIVLSHLVRLTMLTEALQVVQEGLALRAWTPAQLQDIDRGLAGLDLIAGCDTALHGERAGALGALASLQGSPPALSGVFGEVEENLSRLPTGWIDYNKVTLCDWFDRYVFPSVDAETGRINPAMFRSMARELAGLDDEPLPARLLAYRHCMLAQMLIRWGAPRIELKTGRVQAAVDHARLACALERWRQASGHEASPYPDALAALAPDLLPVLPHDPVSGASYVYRREGADGYVLHGVGGDGKDDGGRIEWVGGNPPFANLEKGDWVWRWPPQKSGRMRAPPTPSSGRLRRNRGNG